jgi:hypothetical protein
VVVATSRPDRVEAELGEGDDTFRGGAGTDCGAADRVRLVGDAADNLLDGAGCEIRSSGGSGADRIRST